MSREKFQLEIKVNFRYGHRLLKDTTSKCYNLHGEGGTAIVILEKPKLDNFDKVVDFGKVKKVIKEMIDERYDHTMILNCEDDKLIMNLGNMNMKLLLLQSDPTAERIAENLYWDICSILDEITEQDTTVVKVGVQESFEDSIAWYYGQVQI